MRRFPLICALLAALAAPLFSQRLPDADVPPSSGLSDKSGVLSKNPGARQNILDVIRGLETRHGYRLYVILERSLISSTPNELASKHQQEWLPDGGGLVFVFESDTRRLGFGRRLDAGEELGENNAGVPSYALQDIVSDALHASGDVESPELYVETLVTRIGAGLDGHFKRRDSPVQAGRPLRLALVTIGALSLLALCGMALGWLMGKADKRQSRKRVFPPAEVVERLSAPYGGGGGGYGSFGGGS